MKKNLPVTVLIAVRNEEANIVRCLDALTPAERVIVLDSGSTDRTVALAESHGAEVAPFDYKGGYPKKRQWALDHLPIQSDWIFLVDADEVAPVALWDEIHAAIQNPMADAYIIKKEFHFMGRRFRWGGFSHSAVLFFRRGKARFERMDVEDAGPADMEVHERLHVQGVIGHFITPLIHEDFKGLEAYWAKHEVYAQWESAVRFRFLTTGDWGEEAVGMRLFGNLQERRRFLKGMITRMPFESLVWFIYHYVVRLGFLEGRAGWTASVIRARYIRRVRRLLKERLKQKKTTD